MQRATADVRESFVVFLIGMRINKWWRPDVWVPVARSMGRMVRELTAHPEYGLLGMIRPGPSNPALIVQYWKSVEHLEAFASGHATPHPAAWKDFNARVRATDVVGVWHETYVVEPGRHESIYVNMPPFGLGAAFGLTPAVHALSTARGRLASGTPGAGDS